MHILVTGGCGYLGSGAAARLRRLGHEVTVIDNLSRCKPHVRLDLQDLGVQVLVEDIRSPGLAQQVGPVDCIWHFAGLKSVEESFSYPGQYMDVNVRGTYLLLESFPGVPMVYSSSAAVYGNPSYLPIDEWHPLQPTNPYGESKRIAEQLVAQSKRPSVALRYFNPVGECEGFGDDPPGIARNIIPALLQASAESPFVIKGTNHPTRDGTAVRDYIDVNDLIAGHGLAMDYMLTTRGHHVFNLGTGKSLSVRSLVVLAELPESHVVEEQEPRQGDVSFLQAGVGKARSLLGFQCTEDPRDTIRQIFNQR